MDDISIKGLERNFKELPPPSLYCANIQHIILLFLIIEYYLSTCKVTIIS